MLKDKIRVSYRLKSCWPRFLLVAVIIAAALPRFLQPLFLLHTPDDAYYYLLPAFRFWEAFNVTFDGLTPMSGFHPLWMFTLILFALPFHVFNLSAGVFAVFALVLVVLIWITTSQLIYEIMYRLTDHRSFSVLVSMPAVLGMSHFSALYMSYGFNAMETSMVILTLAMLALYLFKCAAGEINLSPYWLGILSALVLTSRFDMGIFLLLLYGGLLLIFRLREVLTAGIILVLLSLPFFAFNLIQTQSITPQSGNVKNYWSDIHELHYDGQLLSFENISVSNLTASRIETIKGVLADSISEYLQMLIPLLDTWSTPDTIWLILFCVIYIATFALLIKSFSHLSYRVMHLLLLCFLTHFVIILFYYAFEGYHIAFWYYVPGYVVIHILFLSLIYFLTHWVHRHLATLTVVALLIISIIGLVRHNNQARNHALSESVESAPHLYQQAIEWMQQNIPSDAVVSSWAAGQFGYFLSQPVINLEGLVASREVFEASKQQSLHEVFLEYEVDYIVQHFPFADPFTTNACDLNHNSPFWALRTRPIQDLPTAYQVVAQFSNSATTLYVLEVQHDILQDYLPIHHENGTIFEAETFKEGRAFSQTIIFPNSSGLAVHGNGLTYEITIDRVVDLEAKILQPSREVVEATISIDGQTRKIEIPQQCTWTNLHLGVLAPREIPYSIKLDFDSSYIDQLFLTYQ